MSGLPTSIQEVRPSPGFIKLDALLAIGDVIIAQGGLAQPLRAISWAVAGDIKVDSIHNVGEVIPSGALVTGLQHSCVIKKIYSVANGTTATGIIGWY